jgi:hypothetical protein
MGIVSLFKPNLAPIAALSERVLRVRSKPAEYSEREIWAVKFMPIRRVQILRKMAWDQLRNPSPILSLERKPGMLGKRGDH